MHIWEASVAVIGLGLVVSVSAQESAPVAPGEKQATSPLGTVTQVDDQAISVRLTTDTKPNIGDELAVFVKIEGVGEAQVATAKVAAVVGNLLMAKIERATGKVQPGHLVRLKTSAPTTDGKQPPTTDLDRLQGIWECTQSFHKGRPVDQFVGVFAVIEGNNLTWMYVNKDRTLRRVQNADFRIDPAATPKRFDWNPSGEPDDIHRRYYQLDGDVLKWSSNRGPELPGAFEAGEWQFICKRVTDNDLGVDAASIGPIRLPKDVVGRPWLGISRVHWHDQQMLVTGVIPNSPAAKAGLHKGDVIQLIDGKPNEPGAGLHLIVENKRPGNKVVIEFVRGDETVIREMTLEAVPPDGGVKWLHRMAVLNVPWAQMDLAVRYFHKRGHRVGRERQLRSFVEADDAKGVQWMKRAAENGNEWGLLFLADAYAQGRVVKRDEQTAIEWHQRGADKGFPRSMLSLGRLYQFRKSLPPDYEAAARWYERTRQTRWNPDDVNARNAACYLLALLHRDGRGVAKSDSLAVERFREAADRNHTDSMIELAWMYENRRLADNESSLTSQQTNERAVDWYLKAANLGSRRAEYHMGRICIDGKLVLQDYETARSWFLQAAEQGEADAQASLGWLYESGNGVAADRATAIQWYRKAAAQGHAGAKKRLSELGERSP